MSKDKVREWGWGTGEREGGRGRIGLEAGRGSGTDSCVRLTGRGSSQGREAASGRREPS